MNVQVFKIVIIVIIFEDIEFLMEIMNLKFRKKIKFLIDGDSIGGGDGDDDDVDMEVVFQLGDLGVEVMLVLVQMLFQSVEIRFIFFGDFVDCGYFSLEIFIFLMCFKVKYEFLRCWLQE